MAMVVFGHRHVAMWCMCLCREWGEEMIFLVNVFAAVVTPPQQFLPATIFELRLICKEHLPWCICYGFVYNFFVFLVSDYNNLALNLSDYAGRIQGKKR